MDPRPFSFTLESKNEMATFNSLYSPYVQGNGNYRKGVTDIMNHAAFLKLRFADNTRKRDIENLFAEMKKEFYIGITPQDAGSLVGPDVPDHKVNYDNIGIKRILIPEVNAPTISIIKRQRLVKNNPNTINVVYGDYFNVVLDHMDNYGWVFTDLDFDGTMHYKTTKTALIQFISSLHARTGALTDKFTFVNTFSTRQNSRGMYEFNDYQKFIVNFMHSMPKFKIHEAHYVDYTGFGRMATVVLFIEKVNLVQRITKSGPPTMNYYSYYNGGGIGKLKQELHKNSIYI